MPTPQTTTQPRQELQRFVAELLERNPISLNHQVDRDSADVPRIAEHSIPQEKVICCPSCLPACRPSPPFLPLRCDPRPPGDHDT